MYQALTEDSSLLAIGVSSSQDTLDSSLVLLATASNTHLLGEIEGSDKENVDPRCGGNLLDVLNTGTRLDLHGYGHTLLGALVVLGAGVDSGERMRGKHGAVATGSERRVLAPANDLGSINLYGAAIVVRIAFVGNQEADLEPDLPPSGT